MAYRGLMHDDDLQYQEDVNINHLFNTTQIEDEMCGLVSGKYYQPWYESQLMKANYD